MIPDDGEGAGMQVAGAGIVTEAGPGPHHRLDRRGGQRVDGRPQGKEVAK